MITKIFSLRHKIVIFCREQYPHWINGGQLEKLGMELGYKASNSSRRGRELVKNGILERRLNERHCVEYRLAQPRVLNEEIPPLSPFQEPSKEVNSETTLEVCTLF